MSTKARSNADNWAADITGVTAGTGITGGGTSGAVTVTNSLLTTVDAAGDLLYGTGSDAATRLAIGTAAQVLAVNSGATAPEWVTPAAGDNFTLLNAGGTALTGGVSSVTVSGITNANKILIIHENVASVTASTTISLRLNGDTGTNYDRRVQVFISPPLSYATGISGASAQTNDDQLYMGQQSNSTGVNAVVNGYALVTGANAAGVKPIFIASGGANDGTTNGFQVTRIGASIYDSSSAITSVTLLTSNASNFATGTIFVFTSP